FSRPLGPKRTSFMNSPGLGRAVLEAAIMHAGGGQARRGPNCVEFTSAQGRTVADWQLSSIIAPNGLILGVLWIAFRAACGQDYRMHSGPPASWKQRGCDGRQVAGSGPRGSAGKPFRGGCDEAGVSRPCSLLCVRASHVESARCPEAVRA